MRCPTLTAVSILALSSLTSSKPLLRSRDNGSMIYDFSLLQPSPEFKWTPCFDKFTCTVLEVPLDYDDTSAGTIGIAFIKWATNSTNSSSPPQDILVNPGGPGGSGVAFIRQSLDLLQQSLGFSHNLIGFDPRGVNNSGPDLSCFPGRDGTSRFYDPDWLEAVDANSTTSLSETFARAGAFGRFCSAVHSGANSTAKYVNTVATAQDMLHYTEVLAETKGERKDDSKLWYYGVSYGTVLGSTFAALYPNRIGRMILDGVVDVEDYYQGKWAANLPDADAAVSSFFKYCYEGGKEKCEFWDESPEAIEARFHAVFDDLRANPMIVDPDIGVRPSIVTITDFKDVIILFPYAPNSFFPLAGRMMAQLEQRNASLLSGLASPGSRLDDTCGDTKVDVADQEPRQFIACTDANGRFNLSTMEAWVEHVNLLVDQSQYLGEAWAAGSSVNCRELNIKAPDSQVFDGVPSADKTSTPILFIGNTIDPVTPHRAAEKMTKLFGGARLLTQDCVGHASVAAVSACTYKYMRQYISDASLPNEGTVCEVDEVPFQDSTSGQSQQGVAKIFKRSYHI